MRLVLTTLLMFLALTTPAWAESEYTSDGGACTEVHVPAMYFSDVTDAELADASRYAFEAGLIQGYDDGTLRPYGTLTHRHAFLMLRRAGITTPWWMDDYQPITRGEVRMLADLPFNSERWQEGLTRGQLVRLLYRLQDF